MREILASHEDAPSGDMVQLRLLAGVHRVVLRGDAPELARFYPSVGGTADRYAVWPALEPVLRAHVDGCARRSTSRRRPTRSAGRSRCWRDCQKRCAAPDSRRVRLLEPGASAGLNLLVDHFRFSGNGWSAGPDDAHLVLRRVRW